jgi:hypothetical protein
MCHGLPLPHHAAPLPRPSRDTCHQNTRRCMTPSRRCMPITPKRANAHPPPHAASPRPIPNGGSRIARLRVGMSTITPGVRYERVCVTPRVIARISLLCRYVVCIVCIVCCITCRVSRVACHVLCYYMHYMHYIHAICYGHTPRQSPRPHFYGCGVT